MPTGANGQHVPEVPFVLLESDVQDHLHFFRPSRGLLDVCLRALMIVFNSEFCEVVFVSDLG